jgi:hypothetical protein
MNRVGGEGSAGPGSPPRFARRSRPIGAPRWAPPVPPTTTASGKGTGGQPRPPPPRSPSRPCHGSRFGPRQWRRHRAHAALVAAAPGMATIRGPAIPVAHRLRGEARSPLAPQPQRRAPNASHPGRNQPAPAVSAERHGCLRLGGGQSMPGPCRAAAAGRSAPRPSAPSAAGGAGHPSPRYCARGRRARPEWGPPSRAPAVVPPPAADGARPPCGRVGLATRPRPAPPVGLPWRCLRPPRHANGTSKCLATRVVRTWFGRRDQHHRDAPRVGGAKPRPAGNAPQRQISEKPRERRGVPPALSRAGEEKRLAPPPARAGDRGGDEQGGNTGLGREARVPRGGAPTRTTRRGHSPRGGAGADGCPGTPGPRCRAVGPGPEASVPALDGSPQTRGRSSWPSQGREGGGQRPRCRRAGGGEGRSGSRWQAERVGPRVEHVGPGAGRGWTS